MSSMTKEEALEIMLLLSESWLSNSSMEQFMLMNRISILKLEDAFRVLRNEGIFWRLVIQSPQPGPQLHPMAIQKFELELIESGVIPGDYDEDEEPREG